MRALCCFAISSILMVAMIAHTLQNKDEEILLLHNVSQTCEGIWVLPQLSSCLFSFLVMLVILLWVLSSLWRLSKRKLFILNSCTNSSPPFIIIYMEIPLDLFCYFLYLKNCYSLPLLMKHLCSTTICLFLTENINPHWQ